MTQLLNEWMLIVMFQSPVLVSLCMLVLSLWSSELVLESVEVCLFLLAAHWALIEANFVRLFTFVQVEFRLRCRRLRRLLIMTRVILMFITSSDRTDLVLLLLVILFGHLFIQCFEFGIML